MGKGYREAIWALCKSRDTAETIKDYTCVCLCYKSLASIHVTLLEYTLALRCYKLMLKYSWISKNTNLELKAYEGIAHCYYYLENLKKSAFYHKRFMKGRVEPDDSSMKSYIVTRYENKYFKSQLCLAEDFKGVEGNNEGGGYQTERQSVSYKGKIRYKERNFVTDYGQAAEFVREIQRTGGEYVSRDLSEITRKYSTSTKGTTIDYKTKEFKKGIRIRIGTPVRELRDKDLPSPCFEGNTGENLFDQDKKSQALEIIKKRISGNRTQGGSISRSSKTLRTSPSNITKNSQTLLSPKSKKRIQTPRSPPTNPQPPPKPQTPQKRKPLLSQIPIHLRLKYTQNTPPVDYLAKMRESKQNRRSLQKIQKDIKNGVYYTSRNFNSVRKNSEYVLFTHLKPVHQLTIPQHPHFKICPRPVNSYKEENILGKIEEVVEGLRKYGKRQIELVYVKRKEWVMEESNLVVNILVTYIDGEEYVKYKKKEFEAISHVVDRAFNF